MKLACAGFFAFGLLMTTTVASADYVVPANQVSGIHVDDFVSEVDRGGSLETVYDSIPGPYNAFAVAGGVLGADDYESTVTDPTMVLGQFQFVGGVTTAGQSVRVNFFDSDQVLANFFTVVLSTGGSTSIWTISLGANGGLDSTFVVPSTGFVQVVAEGGATGRFWLTTTAPSIGSNDITFGGAPNTHYHAFGMLAVPAPASAALIGLAGLAAARRRRN